MSTWITRLISPRAVIALALAFTIAPALAQDSGRIAIVDTERILLESAAGKAALAELEALRDAKSAEAELLQREIQGLRARLAEGQLSLSDEMIVELQRELEQKATDLRRFQEDANRELQKKRDSMLQTFEGSVMPVINAVGDARGFTMIFRKFESGLIYVDDSIDITDEVISRLDAAGN